MKTDVLDYYLPAELIAQKPADVRTDARLLVLDRSTGELRNSVFSQIGRFLHPGDCLVLNDTKVLPARFFAQKSTGARIEGLFLEEKNPQSWTVMLKGSRKLKAGETIRLLDRTTRPSSYTAELLEKASSGKCVLKINAVEDAGSILEKIGFPPLPPYIKRSADPQQAQLDQLRYQTVYAKMPGAVAAPTAGLHFTDKLIDSLKKAGVTFAYVTLHVGEGTFKPVTADELEKHHIHEEYFTVTDENAAIINRARANCLRIIAVGTTSVRTLESAAGEDSIIRATSGSTSLFITPGYKFKAVDAMITNFHLPKTTLLALVASFAGLENTLAAYRHAVEQRYRFYSFGDAMLIA